MERKVGKIILAVGKRSRKSRADSRGVIEAVAVCPLIPFVMNPALESSTSDKLARSLGIEPIIVSIWSCQHNTREDRRSHIPVLLLVRLIQHMHSAIRSPQGFSLLEDLS